MSTKGRSENVRNTVNKGARANEESVIIRN